MKAAESLIVSGPRVPLLRSAKTGTRGSRGRLIAELVRGVKGR